jgi:hypothetical protein
VNETLHDPIVSVLPFRVAGSGIDYSFVCIVGGLCYEILKTSVLNVKR